MEHDLDILLQTIVLAIFLGILAQVVAHRFKIPAILPLLLLGMGAGPFGLGLLEPGRLGHGLEVFVHLGVAVILFEGGLSLDLRHLRQVGGTLGNLLVVGALVTGVGSAWLAHRFAGASWETAALFGAIVTVTGPTVISPLLRHMVVPRRVRTLLLSEGLMIDPVGAVLAYFVLQWIERRGLDWRTLASELLSVTLWGAILGFAAGCAAILLVRYRHLDNELRNLSILALLLGAFAAAERQMPQSGILASVVMGLTLAAVDIADLNPLKAFKGQLTVLLISILFILLSGQLDLGAMYGLGLGGVWVVCGMIFLVRPLAVLASTLFQKLDWKEKTVLGLTAPRGIVAAAVASVSAIQLRAGGAAEEATILEGLVYLIILTTCTWATLMAPLLPRWLGYYRDPSRRRIVLVGANPLSAAIARIFKAEDWTAVVVDSVGFKLARLREQGAETVCGDARDAETYETAETERDTHVVSLTTNDELNVLVAELVREEFGVEHPVVAMQQPSTEFGSVRRAWIDLLSGGSLRLERWFGRLKDDKATAETVELAGDEEKRKELRSLIREQAHGFLILCGWQGGQPRFHVSIDQLSEWDRVSLLVADNVRPKAGSGAAAAPGPDDVRERENPP